MTDKNKWSNVKKGFKDTKINQSKWKEVDNEIKNQNIYDILDSNDFHLENKKDIKEESIYNDAKKGKTILDSYPIFNSPEIK